MNEASFVIPKEVRWRFVQLKTKEDELIERAIILYWTCLNVPKDENTKGEKFELSVREIPVEEKKKEIFSKELSP